MNYFTITPPKTVERSDGETLTLDKAALTEIVAQLHHDDTEPTATVIVHLGYLDDNQVFVPVKRSMAVLANAGMTPAVKAALETVGQAAWAALTQG